MDATGKGDSSKAPRKGINWLSIFGIVILVVLIAAVIWLMMIWNQGKDNRLIQAIADLAPGLQDMETQTKAQIRDQARPITAAELAADPEGWGEQYYVIEGTVSAEGTGTIDENIALNIFSDTKFKGFLLDEAVVLIDVTGEAAAVPDGTVIRGFGKVFSLNIADVWKLPVVGPNLKREFANSGMSDKVAFFISKGIEVVKVPSKSELPIPPAQAGGPGATPAEATTPPAAGTTPPAAGGTTPPAEGGTTPPEGGAKPPATPPATPPPPAGGGK
jgi:hypothetical protein